MPDMFENLVKELAWLPVQLKKIETFCLKMSSEVFKPKTEHFERVDSHYDADGLVVTYKCNLDGRIYTVKVTPSKD